MNLDIKVVEKMLYLAKKAYKNGEIPVSAVIVDQNCNVVSYAFNNRQKNRNVLGHAEILAILKAEKKIKDWRLDGYKMIVSLEPCDMCSMIIKESRLDEVFYFVSKKNNDFESMFSVNKSELSGYDEYKKEFRILLTSFFDNRR